MTYFIYALELTVLVLITVIFYRVRALFSAITVDENTIQLAPVENEMDEIDYSSSDVEEYLKQAKQKADDLKVQMRLAEATASKPKVRHTKLLKETAIELSAFRTNVTKKSISSNELGVEKAARSFTDHQLDKVNQAVTSKSHLQALELVLECFLIGAIDYIGRQSNYCASNRFKLIKNSLGCRDYMLDVESRSFDEACLDKAFLNENIHFTRAGAKAAKVWLNHPSNFERFCITSLMKDWQLVV